MTQYITLPKQAKDVSGQRFGRLIALGPIDNKNSRVVWLCQCDCGNTKATFVSRLLYGRTQSCGCIQREKAASRLTTHNLKHHPLFGVWANILTRCTNENCPQYADYGGRGISICDEWRYNFKAFYDHVTQLPCYGTEGYTLDRADNNGNYEPSNVRWASRTEQGRNKRSNQLITYNGKTQCISAWSQELGFGRGIIYKRLLRGWTVEKALTTPPRSHA